MISAMATASDQIVEILPFGCGDNLDLPTEHGGTVCKSGTCLATRRVSIGADQEAAAEGASRR
jgi:hypothetical protein